MSSHKKKNGIKWTTTTTTTRCLAPAVEVGTVGRVEVRERLEDWTLRERARNEDPMVRVGRFDDVDDDDDDDDKKAIERRRRRRRRRDRRRGRHARVRRARHVRMAAKHADGHAEKQHKTRGSR